MQTFGGYATVENAVAAYDILVERDGQEAADELMRNAVSHYINTMMNLEMFDMPYVDTAYADTVINSEEAKAYGLETQKQSVVMIKNDGVISEKAEA